MAGLGLEIEDSSINENRAAYVAGLFTKITTDIYGARFYSNMATTAGGGIYGGWANLRLWDYSFVLNGEPLVTSTTIGDNMAPMDNGDGIAWETSKPGALQGTGTAVFMNDVVDPVSLLND